MPFQLLLDQDIFTGKDQRKSIFRRETQWTAFRETLSKKFKKKKKKEKKSLRPLFGDEGQVHCEVIIELSLPAKLAPSLSACLELWLFCALDVL